MSEIKIKKSYYLIYDFSKNKKKLIFLSCDNSIIYNFGNVKEMFLFSSKFNYKQLGEKYYIDKLEWKLDMV